MWAGDRPRRKGQDWEPPSTCQALVPQQPRASRCIRSGQQPATWGLPRWVGGGGHGRQPALRHRCPPTTAPHRLTVLRPPLGPPTPPGPGPEPPRGSPGRPPVGHQLVPVGRAQDSGPAGSRGSQGRTRQGRGAGRASTVSPGTARRCRERPVPSPGSADARWAGQASFLGKAPPNTSGSGSLKSKGAGQTGVLAGEGSDRPPTSWPPHSRPGWLPCQGVCGSRGSEF